MRFIADLHIHSYLSRATSKDLTLEGLARWAQQKGITVVGTGDFTHPRWLAELREKLVPAEPGLYALRPDLERAVAASVPAACRAPVRFALQVEISSIYKRGGKVRKVHNLVFAPDLEAAARFAARLGRIGNIESDGRPILGLDSRDLLEITLETSPDAFLIPAHIWTPWFSALGAMSGFDAIADCFGDLADHVFAVETGLSSDPAMNWRLSSLDRYALVSSSDAHSPEKLGREANRFDCELSYLGMRDALRDRRSDGSGGFLGTLEFFPEEGKYHFAGHRKCGVVMTPDEARAAGGVCPACRKPTTHGVMSRVEELADRADGWRPEGARAFERLVPLGEVLGEILGVGAGSKRVRDWYGRLLERVGPELGILREASGDAAGREGPPLLDEALRRMRAGEVFATAGYDGEYGVVRVFTDEERRRLLAQRSFPFSGSLPNTSPGRDDAVVARPLVAAGSGPATQPASIEAAAHAGSIEAATSAGSIEAAASAGSIEVAAQAESIEAAVSAGSEAAASAAIARGDAANPEQRAVIEHRGGPLLVVAGPGSGKTRTVVLRIARLVAEGASPRAITAISFTRKAAGELGARLVAELGEEGRRVSACTFHSLGLELLRAYPVEAGLPRDFAVLDDVARRALLPDAATGEAIALARAAMTPPEALAPDLAAALAAYQAALAAAGAVDFDELVVRATSLLEACPPARAAAQERARHLFVDELQDMSPAQARLVRALAPPEASPDLCAVGDPDQAIYGFRGSDPGFFHRFTADYPGARVLTLSRCYRCSAPVLAAASAVIAGDPDRAARRLEVVPLPSNQPPAPRPTIYRAADADDEAAFIAAEVTRAIGGTALESSSAEHGGPLAFHDIAVLTRTGAQIGPIEEALARAGIPTSRSGDGDALTGPEAVEILAGLREATAAGAGSLDAMLGALVPGRAPAALRRARDRIARLAAPFGGDARAFLDALPLLTPADALLEADKVALLTLHAAKGLEFSLVVIAGCEEGLLPLHLPGKPTDLGEERRLLYVGMTRARRRLVLTHAARRVRFGQASEPAASRFLADLPAELTTVARSTRPDRPRAPRQLSLL